MDRIFSSRWLFLVLSVAATTTALRRTTPSFVARSSRATAALWKVRGGADFNSDDAVSGSSASSRLATSTDAYEVQLEAVKSSVLRAATDAVGDLRLQLEQGEAVEQLGSQADTIVNKALQEFAVAAPDPGDDAVRAAAYDRMLRHVEASVDAPLHVLYLKQLALVRESALQRFRSATKTSSVSDYEAMLQSDSQFVRQAEEATRPGSDWDFAAERSFLQAVLNQIAESSRKSSDVQVTAAQQSQTAMQFLQSQQQMIQQLQMQLYGQSSPWNVGVAYRIPDTNFNLQGTYQQGRANVQLSCVPDEYAPFLGPNGFTNGVGPGNLGLSLNLSV